MRIVSLFFFLFACAGYAESPPLRLWAILPLTGKGASVGLAIQNGMTLALEDLPRAEQQMVLRFDDDAADSKQTVGIVQRLLGSKQADVILTAFSNAGNAVVPITEAKGVPFLSLAYDRGVSEGKKYAFTFWIDVDDLARAAVIEMQRLGYRKVGLVTTEHEGNIAMRGKLVKAAETTFEFPLSEEVQLGETDFSAQILRLRRAPVDALGLLMHGAHLGQFAKVLREQKIDVPLFTLGNFEDKGVRVSAGGALKGQWYAAPQYEDSFIRRYKERYPGDSTFGAAFGYEALRLVAQTAQSSGSDVQHIVSAFERAQLSPGAFPGVQADGRHSFRFPTTIKKVGEDGID